MPEHPVKLRLRSQILPYFVTARLLKKEWWYRSYFVFVYTTDILLVLATIGVVPPAITGIFATGHSGSIGESASFTELTTALPERLYYPVVLLVIAWVILRVVFIREDGQRKALLAKSCLQELRQEEAKLPHILMNPDPMPEIIKLYDYLYPLVDRYIKQDAWQWKPYAREIQDEVQKELDDLCREYESFWEQPPAQNGFRAIPSGGDQND